MKISEEKKENLLGILQLWFSIVVILILYLFFIGIYYWATGSNINKSPLILKLEIVLLSMIYSAIVCVVLKWISTR